MLLYVVAMERAFEPPSLYEYLKGYSHTHHHLNSSALSQACQSYYYAQENQEHQFINKSLKSNPLHFFKGHHCTQDRNNK